MFKIRPVYKEKLINLNKNETETVSVTEDENKDLDVSSLSLSSTSSSSVVESTVNKITPVKAGITNSIKASTFELSREGIDPDSY
jgi:hypothetical protein